RTWAPRARRAGRGASWPAALGAAVGTTSARCASGPARTATRSATAAGSPRPSRTRTTPRTDRGRSGLRRPASLFAHGVGGGGTARNIPAYVGRCRTHGVLLGAFPDRPVVPGGHGIG